MDIPNAIEAVQKLANSKPIENLFGPFTEKLGELGGDIGDVVRFYVTENLQKVCKKWYESRQSRPLSADTDLGRLIPLLQQASLQSDEELQERWVALLQSATTSPDGVLPSFGNILSQVSAEEARYLDRLFEFAKKKDADEGRRLGDVSNLHQVYDERLYQPRYSDHAKLENLFAQGNLFIRDFERLGIIRRDVKVDTSRLPHGLNVDFDRMLNNLRDMEMEESYSFTEYGISFIKAVTP